MGKSSGLLPVARAALFFRFRRNMIYPFSRALLWHGKMKEGLYNGLDAEFYDELLDGEMDDLPLWRELLTATTGWSLEVGCGTGRILLPLLREGYRVDGIDCSAHMLALLRQKAGESGLEVDARVQPMESMNLNKRYSLIFIPGFSLQMVDSREAIKAALTRFHAHLQPEGKLAVSLFFPWEEMEDDGTGEWRLRKKVKRSDGSRLYCFQSTSIDGGNQTVVISNRYELLDKDRQAVGEEYREVRLFWFYPHEFHLLLEESGFELKETFSDFKKEPIDDLTPHAVFLAKRIGSQI